ncbi:MAG: preprotein translocase subunit SecA [Actinomycetota bacterium]
MLQKILKFGEGKRFKEFVGVVERAGTFEEQMKAHSDAEMRELTDEYKERLAEGETLDDLLPEVFATVREAAFRVLGQRHYDVQLMGGAALHSGLIAEMKTGEGKTLVATAPVYLNALAGKGVHVVTVNDYLAKRDAQWMGAVYRFLGLKVGVIQAQMTPEQRRPAYDADITYGTNNEFGFDYLRDNMAWRPEDRVQRGHHYAVVDEVDSILIDEARTPLIISGPSEESAKWYHQFARIMPRLRREEDYEVDEAKHTVAVTEKGVHRVEEILGIDNLYDNISSPLVHYLQNALRAKELYAKDVEYIVKDGEVLIVDEHTGRILHGRRYSEGLHQAIEAKEGVRIKEENVTLATITLQNYFRMYEKLSGMTGTALTEATEFEHIYKLGVVPIPTNRDMIRQDQADLVYQTEEGKFNAVVEDLVQRHEKGQPVLVGTVSIEKSERLSRALEKRGVPHHVLNAKQHEREAYIVAQAGTLGSVTVATNMAGRGVDIILGGSPEYEIKQELMQDEGWDPDSEEFEHEVRRRFKEVEAEWQSAHDKVVELGGLYVLGTERHESRRIDNQLRGRSGRQGDPGESRFYLSLEDDLMRLFANRMVSGLMEKLKIPEDQPIEAKMVSKAIERAQRQVEAQHFEARKNVLKYDDVINTQREIIYKERNRILDGEDLRAQAVQFTEDIVRSVVDNFAITEIDPSEWDIDAMFTSMREVFPSTVQKEQLDVATLSPFELEDMFIEDALKVYEQREQEIGFDQMREIERRVLLSIVDAKWREHLYEMDYLQEGIGLRAVAQRDPLIEYQREGYAMFAAMQEGIKEEFVRYVFHLQVIREQPAPNQTGGGGVARLRLMHGEDDAPAVNEAARSDKVGRNSPCPCGSGKKFKKCHGASLTG